MAITLDENGRWGAAKQTLYVQEFDEELISFCPEQVVGFFLYTLEGVDAAKFSSTNRAHSRVQVWLPSDGSKERLRTNARTYT